jgi:hypothetical protein
MDIDSSFRFLQEHSFLTRPFRAWDQLCIQQSTTAQVYSMAAELSIMQFCSRETKFKTWSTTQWEQLKAGTFRPKKYTDPKGSRKFTLLHMFSMQAGHIQLDLETLPPILRRAGLVIRCTLSEEEFLRVIWQNFDFTHIGFERVEDLFTQDIEWR